MVYPHSVNYWYRATDDPDQSVRDIPQMQGPATTEADAHTQIANLRAHGYTVQRVTFETTCLVCSGAGRIGKAPKGTRKAKIASLPDWRLTWHRCDACHGHGYTETRDLTV